MSRAPGARPGRQRAQSGERREPWDFDSPWLWHAAVGLVQKPWLRLDPKVRRQLKGIAKGTIAKKPGFRNRSAMREALNLLAWAFAGRCARMRRRPGYLR